MDASDHVWPSRERGGQCEGAGGEEPGIDTAAGFCQRDRQQEREVIIVIGIVIPLIAGAVNPVALAFGTGPMLIFFMI